VAAPRRRQSSEPKRKEILIFAEGAVTEEAYIVFYKRRHRRQVLIEVDEFRGTPLALVERAKEAKTRAEREERRGRGRAQDELWCVFDVDEHPNLKQAIEMAKANGINVAISNPCIELWFLLHFKDQTAHVDRHQAQSECRAALGCGKALTDAALERLAENIDIATGRARKLEIKHRNDGTPAPGNPSSGMWRLMASIIAAALPGQDS
jgi:hypothetical protein